MSIETTLNAIAAMNNDELNQVVAVLNARRKLLSSMKAAQFRVGDAVEFTHSDGRTIKGTVTKLMPKNIQVATSLGMWKVSPGLLRNSK